MLHLIAINPFNNRFTPQPKFKSKIPISSSRYPSRAGLLPNTGLKEILQNHLYENSVVKLKPAASFEVVLVADEKKFEYDVMLPQIFDESNLKTIDTLAMLQELLSNVLHIEILSWNYPYLLLNRKWFEAIDVPLEYKCNGLRDLNFIADQILLFTDLSYNTTTQDTNTKNFFQDYIANILQKGEISLLHTSLEPLIEEELFIHDIGNEGCNFIEAQTYHGEIKIPKLLLNGSFQCQLPSIHDIIDRSEIGTSDHNQKNESPHPRMYQYFEALIDIKHLNMKTLSRNWTHQNLNDSTILVPETLFEDVQIKSNSGGKAMEYLSMIKQYLLFKSSLNKIEALDFSSFSIFTMDHYLDLESPWKYIPCHLLQHDNSESKHKILSWSGIMMESNDFPISFKESKVSLQSENGTISMKVLWDVPEIDERLNQSFSASSQLSFPTFVDTVFPLISNIGEELIKRPVHSRNEGSATNHRSIQDVHLAVFATKSFTSASEKFVESSKEIYKTTTMASTSISETSSMKARDNKEFDSANKFIHHQTINLKAVQTNTMNSTTPLDNSSNPMKNTSLSTDILKDDLNSRYSSTNGLKDDLKGKVSKSVDQKNLTFYESQPSDHPHDENEAEKVIETQIIAEEQLNALTMNTVRIQSSTPESLNSSQIVENQYNTKINQMIANEAAAKGTIHVLMKDYVALHGDPVTSSFNKEDRLDILMSEEMLETQSFITSELSEVYNINCIDCPLQFPLSFIVDGITGVCLFEVTEFISTTASSNSTNSINSNYKSALKSLTQLVYKFQKLWIVLLVPSNEVIHQAQINQVQDQFATSFLKFPNIVILRHVVYIDHQSEQSRPEATSYDSLSKTKAISSIAACICNQSERSALLSYPCSSSIMYRYRPFLKQLQSSAIFLAHCEFLQLFPTINYYVATKLLSCWNLSQLPSITTDYETIIHEWNHRNYFVVIEIERDIIIAFHHLLVKQLG